MTPRPVAVRVAEGILDAFRKARAESRRDGGPSLTLVRDGVATIVPLGALFAREVPRDVTSHLMRAIVAKARPDFTVFLSETWMVSHEKGKPLPTGSYEVHPGRIEGAVVVLEGLGFCRAWCATILPDGMASEFEEMSGESNVGGRFVGLYRPQGPPEVDA